MGFGFMFRLDEDSIHNHLGERKVRGIEEEEEADEGKDGGDKECEGEGEEIKVEDELDENDDEDVKLEDVEEEEDYDEEDGAIGSSSSDENLRKSSSENEPSPIDVDQNDPAVKKEETTEGTKTADEFPDTEIRIQVDASNRVKKLSAFKGLASLTTDASASSNG